MYSGNVIKLCCAWESMGKIDTCLDLLYDYIDILLRTNQMEEVNEILNRLDIKATGPHVLIGLLTLTLPARKLLEARATFYEYVEKELKGRDCWKENLLTGLKP